MLGSVRPSDLKVRRKWTERIFFSLARVQEFRCRIADSGLKNSWRLEVEPQEGKFWVGEWAQQVIMPKNPPSRGTDLCSLEVGYNSKRSLGPAWGLATELGSPVRFKDMAVDLRTDTR